MGVPGLSSVRSNILSENKRRFSAQSYFSSSHRVDISEVLFEKGGGRRGGGRGEGRSIGNYRVILELPSNNNFEQWLKCKRVCVPPLPT